MVLALVQDFVLLLVYFEGHTECTNPLTGSVEIHLPPDDPDGDLVEVELRPPVPTGVRTDTSARRLSCSRDTPAPVTWGPKDDPPRHYPLVDPGIP